MAAGIANDVFWDMAGPEIQAVCEAIYERDRAGALQAGLVASAIYNVNRRKGARAFRPSDFVPSMPKREDFLEPEIATKVMDQWAASMNQTLLPS